MSDSPTPPEERRGFLADLFQTRYREVTLSAVIFAVVIGVVMNAAITYAGLKIGFTIGGSAIAAVLGFGVLRGILRRGSILETNVAQTIASAVNTSNSGVIFTVPVLFLVGYRLTIGDADFWLITLACIAGAMLGTAFIIPLRKQMLDIERLRFPSPTAVAAILKSPGAGPAKSIVLVLGIIAGVAIYAPSGLPALRTAAAPEELQELFDDGAISWADVERTRTMQGWIEAGAAPADLDAESWGKELVAAVEAARAGTIPWSDLRSIELGWAPKPRFNLSYAGFGWSLPEETDAAAPAIDRDGDGSPDPALTVRVDRDQDGRADLIMTDETVDVGRLIGLPDEFQLLFAIAPFAIGAGFLTGRAGLFVLAGGILAFFVLNPIVYNLGWMPATVRADQAPGFGFGAFNRPLGIGLLLGGALMGVLASLPAIKEAVKSIGAAGKMHGGSDELGFKTLAVAAVGGMIFLFLAADFVGNKPLNLDCPVTGDAISAEVEPAQYSGYAIGFATAEAASAWAEWDDVRRDDFLATKNAKPGWLASINPHVRAGIIAIVGAAWIWFAGIIIAQCAGMTDWSPISGMALLTVVLVLLLAGTGAVVGAVLIGAALCVAITLAADMMGDLKTGYIVGAKPLRQQAVELVVVGIGPVVCMLTLMLVVSVNLKQTGIPIGPGTPTVAPQAQALQAVITGVQGGQMPYALYGAGALLGGLLGLGAFSGLGVLIGLSMYLPFMYIATYGIGCVVNIISGRIFGRGRTEEWGVPFCAGLIVGESLLALGINIAVLAGG